MDPSGLSEMGSTLDLAMEPGARISPMFVSGGTGQADQLGGLLDGQSREVANLGHTSLICRSLLPDGPVHTSSVHGNRPAVQAPARGGHQLEAVVAWATRMGSSVVWIVAALAAGYFAFKFARRGRRRPLACKPALFDSHHLA